MRGAARKGGPYRHPVARLHQGSDATKRDVLTFFQGCGVHVAYLATLERWAAKGSDKTKYHITREVLTHVNAQGDPGLAARRQVIRRVTEFENFSGCWPDDQLKARGAVANVAELVNKKDSFTRMQQERERVLREHSDAKRAELDRVAATKSARAQVKAELFRLFGMSDPQERGNARGCPQPFVSDGRHPGSGRVRRQE